MTAGQPKVSLITGAGSGIGRVTALAFARQGFRIVAGDLSADGLAETAQMICDAGAEVLTMQTDVRDASQVEALVEAAITRFGALDVAFNNAGVRGPDLETADYAAEDWHRVLDINLNGTWNSMKYELPAMLKYGGGSIINNASIAGTRGLKNASAYTASKHAVVGLTRSSALEYATRGIRINAICPSYVDTPLLNLDGARRGALGLAGIARAQPMHRLATAEEIAGVVLFLASDAASFITGHAMMVDGGMSAG